MHMQTEHSVRLRGIARWLWVHQLGRMPQNWTMPLRKTFYSPYMFVLSRCFEYTYFHIFGVLFRASWRCIFQHPPCEGTVCKALLSVTSQVHHLALICLKYTFLLSNSVSWTNTATAQYCDYFALQEIKSVIYSSKQPGSCCPFAWPVATLGHLHGDLRQSLWVA